jgi:hypothetical protein
VTRKTIDVTITDEGRDKGKVYRLTEMSAWTAEKMTIRAMGAAVRAGVPIPDDVVQMGVAGFIAVGARAVVAARFDELEPLLDQMMSCAKAVPDPSKPGIERPLIESDIEEVKTFLTLRKAILELHTGFSMPGAPSGSVSGTPGAKTA